MRSKKRKKIKNRRTKPKDFKILIRRYVAKLIIGVKVLFVLASFAGLMYFVLISSYFSINSVEILGTRRFVNAEDAIQIVNQNSLGKNILLFKSQKLEEVLLSNFLGAQKVNVVKKLPHKIVVNFSERVPIAIVYKEPSNQFLVDMDGYVLGHTSPENEDLPKIHYEKELSVGLFIDKNLVPLYMELTTLLADEDISVSSMSFYPKHISFSLSKGESVLIGVDKNMLEAVKALGALLRQASIDNKEIKRIDLRYDKVIVLFN